MFVLGSLLPIEGNYEFRIVESGSMEPAIKTGSVVALIPQEEYKVGDIVMFTGTNLNPTPTTHRIVGRETDDNTKRFVTQGDSNEEPDYRRITEDEITGKVFLSVPYVGYAARYFGTPNGMATLVATIVIMLILIFLPWHKILFKETNE